jgi:2-dehydro-3-deoxyglucarate aldolase/4-hydroxy-2-oxoheptanedioate aldolase
MNNTRSVETLRTCFEKPGMSPGTFLGLASSSAIEVAGLAGCEWVLLDLEHGGGTLEQVGPSVQAANAAGVGLVVRVPKPERSGHWLGARSGCGGRDAAAHRIRRRSQGIRVVL